MKSNEIKNTFKLYGNRTESDYYVINNGVVIPTTSTILHDSDDALVENDEGLNVFKNDFIEKLHPDNIDNKKFWKEATSRFPLFSIAGGIQNISSKYEANSVTFNMAVHIGAVGVLNKLYANKPTSKLLEIGPGYGAICDFIGDTYGSENYWGIDINPLVDNPRIFECDGRNIPNTIPNSMDIVYSINVFQHLSKSQRTSYYKQIFEVLSVGGSFIFASYVITENNKDLPCWSVRGEDNKCYCIFFRQLTEVDIYDELIDELSYIGYDVSVINDKTHYIAFKCVKTRV